MRRSYLYLDLGFILSCNLVCTYCRSDRIKAAEAFSLSEFREQVDAFLTRYRAACLKMSGYGEVTKWRDFEPALALASQSFPKVQIITNGTFSPRVREVLLSFDNVSPNLTIDGHTPDMNVLRTGGAIGTHRRMLDNLWSLARAGRRVELNCVVHRFNAGGLHAYCREVAEQGRGNVVFFPFPVKQFGLAQPYGPLACDPEVGKAQLLACLRDFPDIMPPERYVLDMIAFLEAGGRRNPCHVHWANMGSGGRNERLHCPNYGEDLAYGPMTSTLRGPRADTEAVESRNLGRGGVGPDCVQCFNHFHVVNLWLEGRIDTDEMLCLPSLDGEGVRPIAEAVLSEFAAARL